MILLDDHPVVLEGPLANLELIAGIEVVGLATTGRGGLELVARQRPDLVILDLVFV